MDPQASSRRKFVCVALGAGAAASAWCAPSGCAEGADLEEAKREVEDVLESGMKEWNVPSAGYAIVECGQVVASRSLGVLRAGTNRAANASTLYQAASISKTVAALITLKLVEERTLFLDEDVSPKLRSWHLPVVRQ